MECWVRIIVNGRRIWPWMYAWWLAASRLLVADPKPSLDRTWDKVWRRDYGW